ncbi:MAG: Uma2 family endonuclease [Oscillibacter sp.]|nr:Uma2 family endonuclease [Oscillibacter sp.]
METNLAYSLEYEPKTELMGGKVVAMASPSVFHSTVVGNVYSLFRAYLKGHKCRTFPDNVDVYLTAKDRYIPDVTVVCDRSKIENDGIHGAPDLVVEVLSHSTGRNDRSIKKDVYEQCGVREYWIVDPVSLRIEQYLLENGKFVLRDVFTREQNNMLACMKAEDREKLVKAFPCGIFPDLMIPLEDVFEDVVEPFVPPEDENNRG